MFNTKPSLSLSICIIILKKICIVSKSPNSESPPKIKKRQKKGIIDTIGSGSGGDQAKHKVMGAHREHGRMRIVQMLCSKCYF